MYFCTLQMKINWNCFHCWFSCSLTLILALESYTTRVVPCAFRTDIDCNIPEHHQSCAWVRPSSHRTRSTSQHAHATYGTHCGQWEHSHSLQATSKGLHANVLTRPVWTGPHTTVIPAHHRCVLPGYYSWIQVDVGAKGSLLRCFMHPCTAINFHAWVLRPVPPPPQGTALRASSMLRPTLVLSSV